eukprot:GHVR01084489.1.p1 GENE.GHVR01084489.1~~GHVR01084489.1.p1  ORF type:complete len:280 (+),score=59.18 GHVR01084489.1:643-1482(+)
MGCCSSSTGNDADLLIKKKEIFGDSQPGVIIDFGADDDTEPMPFIVPTSEIEKVGQELSAIPPKKPESPPTEETEPVVEVSENDPQPRLNFANVQSREVPMSPPGDAEVVQSLARSAQDNPEGTPEIARRTDSKLFTLFRTLTSVSGTTQEDRTEARGLVKDTVKNWWRSSQKGKDIHIISNGFKYPRVFLLDNTKRSFSLVDNSSNTSEVYNYSEYEYMIRGMADISTPLPDDINTQLVCVVSFNNNRRVVFLFKDEDELIEFFMCFKLTAKVSQSLN